MHIRLFSRLFALSLLLLCAACAENPCGPDGSDCAPPPSAAPVPEVNAECIGDCEKPADQIFGALAYDASTGSWGLADRSQNAFHADISAFYYCNQLGKKCEIVERVSGGCITVVTADTNIVAWGVGKDAGEATGTAMNKCIQSSKDGGCRLRLANCYLPQ